MTCGGRRESDHCPNAQAAADHAVEKVFAILGVDINDPQQVKEFQESLRFGERMRKIVDKSVTAFILAFVAMGVGAFAYGVKARLLGEHFGK